MAALAVGSPRPGGTFQSQSQAIVHRVDQALQEFTEQMRTARPGGAGARRRDRRRDEAALGAQAAATVWTGTNRGKADDTVVAALDDDIVAIRTAIETSSARPRQSSTAH